MADESEDAVTVYRIDRRDTMDSPPRSLLKSPPVINPEEMPDDTMARLFGVPREALRDSPDYSGIREYLLVYLAGGESRANWDVFRGKIPPNILAKMNAVFSECRRNGFIAPIVVNDRIVFHQRVADRGPSADLCDSCERGCRRRGLLTTGEIKKMRELNPGFKEPAPCWLRKMLGR
jgi:hypothetical protein